MAEDVMTKPLRITDLLMDAQAQQLKSLAAGETPAQAPAQDHNPSCAPSALSVSREAEGRGAISEPEYKCWSCAEYVPKSRMVDKRWSDEGVEFNELICFGCIETGAWRQ